MNTFKVGAKVKVIKITSTIPVLQELMAHLVGMVGTVIALDTYIDNHTLYYVELPGELEITCLFTREELEEVNE